MLEGETKSVESTADVQAFTFADKASRAKLDFLTADAQAQVLREIADIDECLVQVGDALIGETRTAFASLLKPTLKLREEPKLAAKVPVRVQKIALQDVSIGLPGSVPKPGLS